MDDQSVLGKIKGKGEEMFAQLSTELASNPLFLKAFERAMKAKKSIDKTATSAMSAMNVPTTRDIHKIQKRLDAIDSKLEDILTALQTRRRTRRSEE